MTAKLSSCHPGNSCYLETICLIEVGKMTTIAKVPACGVCRRVCGDPKPFPETDAAIKKAFALGWRLLMETHPRPPYYLEWRGNRLVPVGYVEPTEEIPF